MRLFDNKKTININDTIEFIDITKNEKYYSKDKQEKNEVVRT